VEIYGSNILLEIIPNEEKVTLAYPEMHHSSDECNLIATRYNFPTPVAVVLNAGRKQRVVTAREVTPDLRSKSTCVFPFCL